MTDTKDKIPSDHTPAQERREVATVRVTHGGYGMELSTYVAYALPEGTHKLYAALPPPKGEPSQEWDRAVDACAKVAEQQAVEFLSPEYACNQPFSSITERFACEEVAKAIRALRREPGGR